MLLLYDSYRSQITIPALESFADAGIMAYALPAHTSGTTHPLDCNVFASFKAHCRQMLDRICPTNTRVTTALDEMDVCSIITKAYEKRFTVENVQSVFRRCGIHPLDDVILFVQARPRSHTYLSDIANIDVMCTMFDERRKDSSNSFIEDIQVLETGYIDTTYVWCKTADAV